MTNLTAAAEHPVRLSSDEVGLRGAFSHVGKHHHNPPKCCWAFPLREGALAIPVFTMLEGICNVVLFWMFAWEILQPEKNGNMSLMIEAVIGITAVGVVANMIGFLVIYKNLKSLILVYAGYLLIHLLISMGIYIVFLRAAWLSFRSAADTPCPDMVSDPSGAAACQSANASFEAFLIAFTVAFACALLLRAFFTYEIFCYHRVVKRVARRKAMIRKSKEVMYENSKAPVADAARQLDGVVVRPDSDYASRSSLNLDHAGRNIAAAEV